MKMFKKSLFGVGTLAALGLFAITFNGSNVAVAEDDEPEPQCEGDVTPNGRVDVSDLIVVLAQWGEVPPSLADINNDGFVDVQDLLIVLENWGDCPDTP